MLRSNSYPNLLVFYPEIERTLRRARHVRRRIEFENNLHSQTKNLASENNSAYSSDSDFDCDILSSSDTGKIKKGSLKSKKRSFWSISGQSPMPSSTPRRPSQDLSTQSPRLAHSKPLETLKDNA
ncbi:hypothetical protein PIB30_097148 [Stylosanthes scabra]|uniref:Uncharacterized protein n=1 Tax=Stylosanthes scabra TaxID=79078 RepID=A0ABU6XVG6_9FABA|nr:hypothetical protein [Stylosanthes scabra]